MWQIILNWFRANEWLAIWLEGIALVLIFVWDRIDAKGEHEERMEQIEIANKQAEASLLAAQSVMNSERAWVIAKLRWYEGGGRLVFGETSIPPKPIVSTTSARFVLEVRNDGKTPAWIETILAGMEISRTDRNPENPLTQYIEPLGSGKGQEIALELHCDGKPQLDKSDSLNIHLTIKYRDIFEDCVMNLRFSVDPHTYSIKRLNSTS